MKKKLSVFMTLVIVIMNVFASNAIAEIDLIHTPVVKHYAHSDFVYSGTAMRIQNSGYSGWGNGYILEFDAQLPQATNGVKYTQKFNCAGQKSDGVTNIYNVAHSSVIKAVENDSSYIWEWKSDTGTETVVLNAGVNYHFVIAVDLLNYTHSWEIKEGETVVGASYNEAFYEQPSSEVVTLLVCQDIRFDNSWATNGAWGDTKPQNVKITRNKVFAKQKPEITFGDGVVTAEVPVCHNIPNEVDSPVLMLCVYDPWGIMVGSSVNRLSFPERTTTIPTEKTLQTRLETKLTDGMTVKAVVLGSLSNRITAVESTERIYSE